jgi:exosortase A-associated hydrolase 2
MKLVTKPVFLEGSRGRLFGLYFGPQYAPRGAMLYLPPFAEEMNRCRALAAAQARAFAEKGIGCLLLDPYGTGESDGDLEDASWTLWKADALQACDWLKTQTGVNVSLWGLRLGGLLAGELFEGSPDRFERLLLWQPLLSGKQYMTQYLRLRVAWLMERGLPAETTDGIRQALANGETIEVAGYPITSTLADGMDAARFPAQDRALGGKSIHWLENATTGAATLSVGAQQAVGKLEARGAQVSAMTFAGPPLWQLHERDDLSSLVSLTTPLFGEVA